MTRPRDGTVSFVLQNRSPGWCADNHRYEFPEREYSDASVSATKNPDRTVDLTFHISVLGGHYSFHAMIPPGASGVNPAIEVLLTWHGDTMKLYLNRHLVSARRI